MNSTSSTRRGFTLIEMLVSISVLSFMLLMMAQMTGLAEQAWRVEQNRIDNFSKARSMVDMVTDDLQRAVVRGDLPIFNTSSPNATPTVTANGLYYFPTSTMTPSTSSFTNAFYTRLPGVPASASTQVRDISLVSYTIVATTTPDRIVLQRSDLAVPWTSSQNVAFQGNMATLLSSPNSTPREVAPGVVGFRLAFRRADGTMIDSSQYSGYDPTRPVVAVDVGVAVIGKESLSPTLLTAAQIQNIQTALAGATITNGVKASWDQTVLTPSFYASYPKTLGGGLKTFERWVACPAF